MDYLFKCKECGKPYELSKGMTEEFTKEQLLCKKKKCNGELTRDYSAESSSRMTIIPEHMKGVNMTNHTYDWKYNRSPSGKKHHWAMGK